MKERGGYAQALMSKAIELDGRKDAQVWAIRRLGPVDAAGGFDYWDVRIEACKREPNTREAQFFGNSRIVGGFKLTVPGNVALRQTAFGDVGDITEDTVIVAGSGYDTSGAMPFVTDAQVYDIVHVHRHMNGGHVQEYYLYVSPASGGPSRG